MRKVPILAAVLAVIGLGAQSANAQEVTVEIGSSYIDTGTFNDRFSDEPIVRLTGLAMVTEEIYVEGYVYSGFTDPFNDDSSEYGLEVGGEWEVAESTILNIAGGRWANYYGEGFSAGDWFVAARVTHGNFTIAATALSGDTDMVILHAQHELPVAERLTIVPSVAYYTADGTFNPGLSASYSLRDDVAVNLGVVYPETDEGRKLYAAVSITFTFGGE